MRNPSKKNGPPDLYRSISVSKTLNGLSKYLSTNYSYIFLTSFIIFVLHIPDIRPLIRYYPASSWSQLDTELNFNLSYLYWIILTGYLGINLFILNIIHKRQEIFSSPIIVIGLLAVIFLVVTYIYSLKGLNAGTDQDDALFQGSRMMLRWKFPYFPTWAGNPMSPGPGWLFLTIPFALVNHIEWFNLSLLSVMTIMLGKRFGWHSASIFLFILLSSLTFWETITSGSDLPAIGLAIAITVLCMHESHNKILFTITVLLAGVLATSRLIFIFIPVIIGIMFWKKDKKTALFFMLSTTTIAAILFAIFYVINPESYLLFGPFHIIGKATSKFASYELYACIFLLAAFILLLCFRILKTTLNFTETFFLVGILLFVPLLVISTFGLRLSGWKPAIWEESSYMLIPMPALVTSILVNNQSKEHN